MDIRDIRDMKRKLESLDERIARLRSAMEGGNRIMRLMPGGGKNEDRLAADMARLLDMEKRSLAKKVDLEAAIMDAEQQIEFLPEQQQKILRLRYVDGANRDEEAKKAGYSMSHCRTIHAKAMKNLIARNRFNVL